MKLITHDELNMETPKNPPTLTINPISQVSLGQNSIYFNGVGVSLGATDISITLLNGNRMVGQIQATPPVLKSLIKNLENAIAHLEKATDTNFPTLEGLVQQLQTKQAPNQS